MESKIEAMLDNVELLRKESWGKDEEIYKLLGAVMGKLIDIRKLLRDKLRNGETIGIED